MGKDAELRALYSRDVLEQRVRKRIEVSQAEVRVEDMKGAEN